jgi:hypothetical protein
VQKLWSGVAILVLAAASAAVAATQQTPATKTMPTCKGTTGPVVWYVPANKAYYIRANPHFGKGAGEYMCRVDAIRSIRSAGSKSTSSMKSMTSTTSMKSTSPKKATGQYETPNPNQSPQTTPEPSSTG